MVGRDVRGGRDRQGRREDGRRRLDRAVPKLTVIVGGSFGAGNYGMCGRAYSPALPLDVAERAHLRDGRRAGGDGDDEVARATGADRGATGVALMREQYERQGHPYYATARLWDDGVIDPLDTRDVLGLALSAPAPTPRSPSGASRSFEIRSRHMAYARIVAQRRPRRRIAMDREERLNALGAELVADVVAALHEAEADREVRAAVLEGRAAPSPPAATSPTWANGCLAVRPRRDSTRWPPYTT